MKLTQVIQALDKFSIGENKLDKIEIRKFRKLIEEKKYSEAMKFYLKMDTFLRDGVPEEVLLFLREKDSSNKKVEFRFCLKDDSGKEIASAIATYHVTDKEKQGGMFAASVFSQANDWRDSVAKLEIKEIK